MIASYAGHEVHVADWQDGFKACCPSIPGCVYRSRNPDTAIAMVRRTIDAVHEYERNGRSPWITELPS